MTICPYCKTDSTVDLRENFKKNNFSLYTCRRCHNNFIDPIPSADLLNTYYESAYGQRTVDEVGGDHMLTPLFVRLIRKYHPRAQTICEVGCSEGNLLHGLQSSGYAVEGYDLSERSAELAQKVFGLAVHCGDFTGQSKKKYDVIIASHLIEHVRDPMEQLNCFYSALKKDGILILITPNFGSLLSRIFKRHHPWFDPPQHLHYFTKKNLTRNLQHLGLTIRSAVTRQTSWPILSLFCLCIRKMCAKVTVTPNHNTPSHVRSTRTSKLKKIYKTIEPLLKSLSKPIDILVSKLGLGDDVWVVSERKK